MTATLTRRTQEERSAATRALLLDAAVACLVERGIAQASLPEICRRAGVSRGAQLHHFPTRAELLAAAVEHLFAVRHAAFRQKMASVPVHDLDHVLAELWGIYTSGPLYAWLELVTAARTDPELRAHVAAVDRRFEDEATETLVGLFSVPADRGRTAARMVTSLLDGLATHQILADDEVAARRVLDLFAAVLRPLIEGGR